MPEYESTSSPYITDPRRARHWLPKAEHFLHYDVPLLLDGAKFILNHWGMFCKSAQAPRSFREASACGFSGCSGGWLGLHPDFRRAGFKTRAINHPEADGTLVVEFRGVIGTPGLARFFGLVFSAAEALFGASQHDWRSGEPRYCAPLDPHDPSVAAGRIERFLIDHDIPLLPPPAVSP